MESGAQEMGSTSYPGTIQDLTFNLFSILADQYLSANALFWITVWITAVGRDPRTVSRGSSFAAPASWTQNGLLGAVARSGSELTLWDLPLMFSDIAMLYPSYSCANVSSYLLGSPEAQATPSPRFIFAICAMSASSMEKEKMSKFWRIRS